MRFTAIEAAQFGGLCITRRLELAPGLNVIAAPNQAGKTSLLTLIEWVLYGVPPAGTKHNVQNVERWTPWGGGKPGAVLELAPEQADWPQAVRLDARFGDFQLFVSDPESLESLNRRVHPSRNGTWDLGRTLLGLQREAFKSSLLALQGELEDVLSKEQYIRILTADLAELVEDPEKARLDTGRLMLEQPRFTCAGLGDNALLLPNLLRNAEKIAGEAQAQCEKLTRKYTEIESALGKKEQAEQELALKRAVLARLETQREQSDLAAAHWRYSLVHRYAENLRDAAPRLKQAPFLEHFPAGLEREVQSWQGDREHHRRDVDKLRNKRDQTSHKLAATEEQLREDEPLAKLLDVQQDLVRLALALDMAQKERSTAEWKIKEYGEAADPLTRTRYEMLDERIKPHRAYVPELMQWAERSQQSAAAKRLAETRRGELKPLAQRRSSAQFLYAGLLVLAAAACVAAGIAFDNAAAGSALAGLLAALALWLVGSGVRSRRQAGQARIELNMVIEPRLAELAKQQSELQLAKADLQARYGLDDATWAQLAQDLPEYQPLLLKLQSYAQASRDREEARQRTDEVWADVRTALPSAPPRPDAEWLTRALSRLEDVKQRKRECLDLRASVKDLERDLQELGRHETELAAKLGQTLAPVGLEDKARRDPDAALQQFEALLREARDLQAQRDLLATAEDQAQAILMPRDEYERRINALTQPQLLAVTGLAKSEADYAGLHKKRLALQQDITKARQNLEIQQRDIARLREQLAKDEDALLELPEAQAAQAAAVERLSTLQRWQRAIELLRDSLAALQREMASNLAPLITAELVEVLREAPVRGVGAAALGENLELRLRVDGAPPGLDGRELLERLSTGARRQLALALRVAIAAALSGKRHAPLLLDEPLAELDDEHALACFSYLSNIGQAQQVLLTTCHGEHLQWLLQKTGVRGEVVRLPEVAGA